MLSAPLYASHQTLSLDKSKDFTQKRVTLLKSKRDALVLLKRDTKELDAEIAVAENSLKALHTQS